MQLVIDLGAHCLEGVTKLLQDQVVNKDAHIFSVEANPNTFSHVLTSGTIENFRDKNHLLSSFHYVNFAVGPKIGFVKFNSCAVVADNFKRVREPWLRRYYLIKDALKRIKRRVRSQHASYTHTSQGSNILDSPPNRDGDHAFNYTSSVVPQFPIIDITQYVISNILSSSSCLDLVLRLILKVQSLKF